MSAATRKLKYGGLATLPLPEPKINTHGAVGVDPHELLQFLLPTGFFHSKSTARLYIFAECGPTLVKVREGWMSLRAGYKGMHVVTEQELEDMIHEMIREDILRVYVGNAVLTPTEQEEVISQVRPRVPPLRPCACVCPLLRGAAAPSLRCGGAPEGAPSPRCEPWARAAPPLAG